MSTSRHPLIPNVRHGRVSRWISLYVENDRNRPLSLAGDCIEFPLTARIQRITRECVADRRVHDTIGFRPRLTIDECGDGDPTAASEAFEVFAGNFRCLPIP